MLSILGRASRRSVTATTLAPATRKFSAYTGQAVTDEDLVQQKDDWVIEETNFCLGIIVN